MFQDRADVRAQGNPNFFQRLGRFVVLDCRRPDAADRRERATDGSDDVGNGDLLGRSREAKASITPALGLDDLGVTQLDQDVLQERGRNLLCLRDLLAFQRASVGQRELQGGSNGVVFFG